VPKFEEFTAKLLDEVANSLSGPMGVFTTTGPNTMLDGVSFESIHRTMVQFQAETRRIEDDLLAALGDYIARSGEKLYVWAERLDTPFPEFVEILGGKRRPIPARFWDQVRRVFDATKSPRLS
jgi:hypothetical protein